MISGRLDGLQAVVSVPFLVPGNPFVSIEFVVDTGFEGALTLPPEAIAALGLTFFEPIEAKLANDAPATVDSYIATVLLDGRQLDVLVLAMGTRPLLGTSLLKGKELLIQFLPGGLVSISDPKAKSVNTRTA
jgi:clan AA aspartic protease